jgi:uncharacterized protein YfaS (alpha-2-macroglobulin family)
VDAAGRLAAAQGVTWTLVSENWDYDWYQQDGRWQYRRTSRDAVVARGGLNVAAEAPARFSRRLAWGDYRLELSHPATGALSVIRFAPAGARPRRTARRRIPCGWRSRATTTPRATRWR